MPLLERSVVRRAYDSLLVNDPNVTLKLVPDRGVRASESLMRSLWEIYLPPIKRIESWRPFKYRLQESFTFTIRLDQSVTFFLTIPKRWESYVKGKISLCWPRVTVTEDLHTLSHVDVQKNVTGDADPPSENVAHSYVRKNVFRPHKIVPKSVTFVQKVVPVSCQLSLKKHDFYSLALTSPLAGILENVRDLVNGESIQIRITSYPMEREDWTRTAQEAYKAHRKGEKVQRLDLDLSTALEKAVEAIDGAFSEAAGFLDFMMGTEKTKEVHLPSQRALTSATIQKMTLPTFATSIKITVESPDPMKARVLLKSVANAFNEMAGDNEFTIKEHSILPVRSVLSSQELSRIVCLPGFDLQMEYPQIERIEHRQSRLPALVTSEGILIGHATRQGKDNPVYLPTKSLDELCLPHVVIGGMGCGKTKGFAANLAVEAVKNGFGAIVIDPERGEIGDEVSNMIPVTRVRFGTDVLSLDWREALHSPRSRNRLANEIVSFCEAQSDEAGAQTVRFLRSASKIAPTGSLKEIVEILTNIDYLKTLNIPENEKATWDQYMQLSEARRNQIAMPVLNRLDIIQGDDYLAECMESKRGLDFVTLLDVPRCVVVDIPKGLLGREAADILGALISTKVDLAMTLRQSRFPVFVISDEPFQYMRSARVWRSAAVESRKWRFSFVWLFHSWEQIPKDLALIIKSANPHYHIYRSSKETYQSLAEELRPFELEELLQIPRFHAVNVIQANGTTVTPFLARMLPPPGMRKA
jgi:hypothetical protein